MLFEKARESERLLKTVKSTIPHRLAMETKAGTAPGSSSWGAAIFNRKTYDHIYYGALDLFFS